MPKFAHFRILRTAYFEATEFTGFDTWGLFYCKVKLTVLQVLHYIWFFMILRILYNYIITGQVG